MDRVLQPLEEVVLLPPSYKLFFHLRQLFPIFFFLRSSGQSSDYSLGELLSYLTGLSLKARNGPEEMGLI